MSDDGTKRPSGKSGSWTDAEKLTLLFAVIDSSVDKIDWKSVKLPEGRSLKACQVWLDKQRTILKKLKTAEGGENDEEGAEIETPIKSKKRGAKAAAEGEEGEEATPKAKKPKTPRKKKETPAKVKAGAESEMEIKNEQPASEEPVSEEPVTADMVKGEVLDEETT